jgi:electron transport complex protein RnfE
MKRILNGIISENPTFVLLLGLCPALAVTTKFENAYLMGLCVMIVLLFTNIVVSLIKKFVNENVKIPVFILIIGTFVTTLEILLEKYIPNLYEALGVYLPLIVVNCIVLGRAIEVASKESVKNSILDAIGVGLGFTLAISLIALIREVLGTNTITLMDSISSITGYRAIYTNILPNSNILPMQILVSPAGSFLVLGMLIALFNKIGGKKNDTN